MTIFGGLTGGWAVVLVLVVEIVRVGADEVKTTLDSLAAATSSAKGAALVKVFGKKNQGLGQGPGPGPDRGRFVRQGRGPSARVVGMGNARRDGVGRTGWARRTCVEEQRRRGQKSRSLPFGS